MNKLQSSDDRIRKYFTALFQIAQKLNPRAYVSSVTRSRSDQAELYKAYVSGRSRFPAAAPGTSKHERGLAMDIGGLQPAELRYLGAVWKRWGGRWGGSFKDPIHFESKAGT